MFITYGNMYGQISGLILLVTLPYSNPIISNDDGQANALSAAILSGIQLPQFNISINQVACLKGWLSSDYNKCSTQKINILFKNII